MSSKNERANRIFFGMLAMLVVSAILNEVPDHIIRASKPTVKVLLLSLGGLATLYFLWEGLRDFWKGPKG
jgi:D-alanyl-lipoteichoic acid acyltransferase DltB (MBOAT superfamily)